MYKLICDRYGADLVFRDATSLKPGAPWPTELREKVIEAEVVMVLIRDVQKWLGVGEDRQRRIDSEDDWVRKEIEAALRNRRNIIPVLIDGASLVPSTLPESIRRLSEYQVVEIGSDDLCQEKTDTSGLESLMLKLDSIAAEYYIEEDELVKVTIILKRMIMSKTHPQPDDEDLLSSTKAMLAGLERELRAGDIYPQDAKVVRARIIRNLRYLLNKYE